MKTYRILVTGKVQGVRYRLTTKEKAIELGLTGWVKNLKTGQVEILIQGNQEQYEKFINYVKKGPLLSKVTNIEVKKVNYNNYFSDFKILKSV